MNLIRCGCSAILRVEIAFYLPALSKLATEREVNLHALRNVCMSCWSRMRWQAAEKQLRHYRNLLEKLESETPDGKTAERPTIAISSWRARARSG